jgi:hypothetical protein
MEYFPKLMEYFSEVMEYFSEVMEYFLKLMECAMPSNLPHGDFKFQMTDFSSKTMP